jgi:hypothetical protein
MLITTCEKGVVALAAGHRVIADRAGQRVVAVIAVDRVD